MITIPLSKGLVACVDEADAPGLVGYSWTASTSKDGLRTYAVRSVSAGKNRRRQIKMHRQLMDAKFGEVIDHKDLDGLNNQRDNLRRCTQSPNVANGRLRTNNTSGFKGVSWSKPSKKWMAYIRFNAKRIYLGLFVDPIEAAKAYDVAATKYFGEFARLNFPLTTS